MFQNRFNRDWDCPQCGQKKIFGSKDKCGKCGCYRSKGVPSTSYQSAVNASVIKPGDWTCVCGVNNFAKRDKCFKCDAARVVPQSAPKEETKSCVICMDRPLEVLIKSCKHICMCEICCYAVTMCPVCRGPYDPQTGVEKVFLSV